MLEARSIAVVGASDRPDSFGLRLATEALRSPSSPTVHLVHPDRRQVLDRPCVPSLADIPDPVDLVLLGVPDRALDEQLALASRRGDAGAVVFGSAIGRGAELVAAADGMALCGAGCMGFVNVARGVRAIGYLERSPLPVGSIALVTHSGSVFSALLRTHRRLEYSLVVSSGQELVCTAADYLAYALQQEETRVIGLLLETLRDVPRLRECLVEAADRSIPVVALTVGGSPTGRALVDAHSGAIAGDDAAWEALFAAYGVHRVDDLGELTDSLEAFSIARRVRSTGRPLGVATAHDSGAERVLVADVAARLKVPFAPLSERTTRRLDGVLEPGLLATNPLDVWGTGSDTEELFTDCLLALAEDESVGVVALAVDLVPEYDGDEAFPRALETLRHRTDKPVVVLSHVPSAIDQEAATRLRAHGVPVLEGTRSGLRAMGHLIAHAQPPVRGVPSIDMPRRDRWSARLASDDGHLDALSLLHDYGIATVPRARVSSADDAVLAARRLGFPVVLKTARGGITHKLDVGGVQLGLADDHAVRTAYDVLERELGGLVEVQRQVEGGVELALGVVSDPLVGPLVVVASGGSLVELMHERAVALPPVAREQAATLLASLRVSRLLDGYRGGPARDTSAAVAAILAIGQLAVELGPCIDALDVNPLIVSGTGAVAVDALVVARQPNSVATADAAGG